MAAAAGALLAALAAAALLINLYFASLAFGRWPGLRRVLGRLFTACGAETSSCAVVVSRQPSVIPLSSGFTSTVRSPLSHVRRSRPVWPARYRPSLDDSVSTLFPVRDASDSNRYPHADNPASTPT